jgi:hypothetical protein
MKWRTLRPQFAELLYTWSLHESELRLKDPRPAPSPEMPDWQEQFEARYGVGDREVRRQMLDETLEVLELSDADPERVLTALQRVRVTASDHRTSWVRERLELLFSQRATKIRESMRSAATEFLELHAAVGSNARNETTAAAAVILRNLDTYPLLNPPKPRESGARKAGHQPEPWSDEARRDLKAAGVTAKSHQTDLLVAVGVLAVSSRSRLGAGRVTPSRKPTHRPASN